MAFKTERIIEFRDTDAAGIAHFSVFFPLMESAEHEMLRSLGMSVMPDDQGAEHSPLTWPRVSVRCDYLAPVRFEDRLQIAVTVEKIGVSSVIYRFDLSANGTDIARGSMTAVCCRLSEEGLEKVEIPDSVRKLLSKHQ